jgi:hypothetical protein
MPYLSPALRLHHHPRAAQASVPLQMRFRSLRTAHSVEVAPLLGVAPGVAPAGSDMLQYMLRLDLECDRVSGRRG